MDPSTRQPHGAPYLRLHAMVLLSFLAMYGRMYARVDRFGNVLHNLDQGARAGLMAAAMDYARRLAANAPLAVQAAKELAVRSRDLSLTEGLRMEQLFLRVLQGSEDVTEGVQAFAERRPPVFNGR